MPAIKEAKAVLADSQAILICTGAGMGVDSGLPDFRGNEGFWNAYPAFKGKYNFQEMANPRWFHDDPYTAWGFYGHRYFLYKRVNPHNGFNILKQICSRYADNYFIFTSNVDGHFQKADFDSMKITECHGSIHYLQCSRNCSPDIWPVETLDFNIDEESCRAVGSLPVCPHCSAIARPNILMFGDWHWNSWRTGAQEERLNTWLSEVDRSKLAVIECGAGTAVPTVRHFSERSGGRLIRINPRDAHGPPGTISIAETALNCLIQLQ